MSADLLPCPFCGGEATKYHRNEGHGWMNTDWVCCNTEECGCQTCLHETEAEAIAAWNRRAATSPAGDLVSEAAVEQIMAWVREDVLPAYGITHATRASDPEMAEGARAALTAALSAQERG